MPESMRNYSRGMKETLEVEMNAKTQHEFTVAIPIVGTVSAPTLDDLSDAAWTAVHNAPNGSGTGYGASEIGSRWPVARNGVAIGTMRYNGRFDAAAEATPVPAPSVPPAGHTPGPWFRIPHGDGFVVRAKIDGKSVDIAWVANQGRSGKEFENACVLASAPELLTALAALIDDSWSDISGQPCVPNVATVKAARAALAKAGV